MRIGWEDPDDVEAELRALHGDDVVQEWVDAARRKDVTWLAPWLRACENNYLADEQARLLRANAPSRRSDDSHNQRRPPAQESAENIAIVAAYLRGSYEWPQDQFEPVAIKLIRYWLTKDDLEQLRIDNERSGV